MKRKDSHFALLFAIFCYLSSNFNRIFNDKDKVKNNDFKFENYSKFNNSFDKSYLQFLLNLSAFILLKVKN